jgi:NarL family two-component system response regulator LiaR
MARVIKVLLAEDHVVVREATAEVIDHQPDMVVVGQAGTGAEAVALALQREPDVVVMDIAMPRVNGLEATRQIRTDFPHCRVLVLTAHLEEENIIQLLQAGAAAYLPKTVGLEALLETIRAVARGESVLPPEIAAVVLGHLRGKEREELSGCPLTERELEVLKSAAAGMTNSQIAQRLAISVRTVEAHLTHVYDKLSAGSRTEAVVRAIKEGWLRPEEES